MSEVMVTLDLDVKAEFIDGMCAGLPESIKETATRPGFIAIRIVRQPGTTRVFFAERWASEQDYNNYIAWRTERGVMGGFAAALNQPAVTTIWPCVVATV